MKDLDLETADLFFEDVDPTPMFDDVDVPVDPFQAAVDRVVSQVFDSEPAVDRDYEESVWEAMDFNVPDFLDVDDHFPSPHEYDGRPIFNGDEVREWAAKSSSPVDQSLPDAPPESDPEIKK